MSKYHIVHLNIYIYNFYYNKIKLMSLGWELCVDMMLIKNPKGGCSHLVWKLQFWVSCNGIVLPRSRGVSLQALYLISSGLGPCCSLHGNAGSQITPGISDFMRSRLWKPHWSEAIANCTVWKTTASPCSFPLESLPAEQVLLSSNTLSPTNTYPCLLCI